MVMQLIAKFCTFYNSRQMTTFADISVIRKAFVFLGGKGKLVRPASLRGHWQIICFAP